MYRERRSVYELQFSNALRWYQWHTSPSICRTESPLEEAPETLTAHLEVS